MERERKKGQTAQTRKKKKKNHLRQQSLTAWPISGNLPMELSGKQNAPFGSVTSAVRSKRSVENK
jgi:hypothetical protein